MFCKRSNILVGRGRGESGIVLKYFPSMFISLQMFSKPFFSFGHGTFASWNVFVFVHSTEILDCKIILLTYSLHQDFNIVATLFS